MQSNADRVPSCLTSGRALFLPLQGSLWDLRRVTKKGIANRAEPCPYTVVQIIDFYPQMIDWTLSDERSALLELRAYEAAMTGKKGDALCCVAFWDALSEEGIVFHKSGREVLSAYLPPLTMADVIREQSISCRLKELSQSARGIPMLLDHSIRAGRHCLSDLLECMGRWLE